MRYRPNTTRPADRRRDSGFSLTELLVVISIIVMLIGLTFPILSALQSGSRIEAGLNTVGMAVDVARQWVKPMAWTADSNNKIDDEYERYNGTAALFCPTGEVRMVYNYRNAQETPGDFLEEQTAPITRNGFADVPNIDYVSIPRGVGVVGVLRRGGSVEFIAPPFAVAFNEFGNMDFGNELGLIYYDSSQDRRYERTTRPNGYDPQEWEAGSANTLQGYESKPIFRLPYEGIECVPGVVIFTLEDFYQAGYDFSGGGVVDLDSDEGQWLRENGKTIFFSPHTGSALRGEGDTDEEED